MLQLLFLKLTTSSPNVTPLPAAACACLEIVGSQNRDSSPGFRGAEASPERRADKNRLWFVVSTGLEGPSPRVGILSCHLGLSVTSVRQAGSPGDTLSAGKPREDLPQAEGCFVTILVTCAFHHCRKPLGNGTRSFRLLQDETPTHPWPSRLLGTLATSLARLWGWVRGSLSTGSRRRTPCTTGGLYDLPVGRVTLTE